MGQAIMTMLEATKFFINILTEISSKSYGIFMNLHMSLRQPYFQNGSSNENVCKLKY